MSWLFLESCRLGNPRFSPEKVYLRPTDTLFILPDNEAAEKIEEDITYSFRGLKVHRGAKAVPHRTGKKWAVDFTMSGIPDTMLGSGSHTILLHASGAQAPETLTIVLDQHAPSATVNVIGDRREPMAKTIKGKIIDNLQMPQDSLSVEIVLNSDGYSNPVQLPITRRYDSARGLHYFEFETVVSGVPARKVGDSGYSAPFFAFRVKDQAGNEYFSEQSYAQFIAPGENSFGIKDIANLRLKKVKYSDMGAIVRFHLVQNKPPIFQLPDGKDAIHLRVVRNDRNVKQLQWEFGAQKLREDKGLTLVYRDEKNVGVTYENGFKDETEGGKDSLFYRVEKKTVSGEVYSSRRIPAPPIPISDSGKKNEEEMTLLVVKPLRDSIGVRVVREGKEDFATLLRLGKQIQISHPDTVTVFTSQKQRVEVTVGANTWIPKRKRFRVYREEFLE